MISRLSDSIAAWLAKEGVVADSDRNLFRYAAYSLLFGLLPIVMVVVLGLVLDMLTEGLLLIAPFMLIRKFSGGYHLKSSGICILLSASVLALAFAAVWFVTLNGHVAVLTAAVATAALSLSLLNPIDSDARKLSEKETVMFRTVARILTAVMVGIYLVLLLSKLDHIAVPVGVGIVLAAALQLPCLLQKARSRGVKAEK